MVALGRSFSEAGLLPHQPAYKPSIGTTGSSLPWKLVETRASSAPSLWSHGYPGMGCTCAHSHKAHGRRALITCSEEEKGQREVAVHPTHGSGREPAFWKSITPHIWVLCCSCACTSTRQSPLALDVLRCAPDTWGLKVRHSQAETAVLSVVTLNYLDGYRQLSGRNYTTLFSGFLPLSQG